MIDRDTASRLGITASTIDQMLYDAFGQREVSTMYTGLNQYFVVMEVDPKYQLSPDSLDGIYVKASNVTGAAATVPTLGSAGATSTTAATTSAAAPASSFTPSTGDTPAVFPTSGGHLATSTSSTTSSNSLLSGTLTGINPAVGAPASSGSVVEHACRCNAGDGHFRSCCHTSLGRSRGAAFGHCAI